MKQRPNEPSYAPTGRDAYLFKHASLALTITLALLISAVTPFIISGNVHAVASPYCGNAAPVSPMPIRHLIIVMLENNSYKQVVGSPNAPFQTSLANSCGSATAAFGATHTSAANYLATSAGEYPAKSPAGCGSVSACADSSDNIYRQLDSAGKTWRSYQESMPYACATKTSHNYKIGHNPPLFYTSIPNAECKANDLPVNDATAQSGALWNDMQNQTLPSVSWVTPSLANDGEGPGGSAAAERAADTWLHKFVGTMQSSNSYNAGDTALLVTYDEGTGHDAYTGENCANQSLDMPVANGVSSHQDSCHVALFTIYPYTPSGSKDGTFFDHYSITKTVEDLFGLPYLAHAADSQTNSLVGHFGI